jgi:flagellar basal body-associated protein FliL
MAKPPNSQAPLHPNVEDVDTIGQISQHPNIEDQDVTERISPHRDIEDQDTIGQISQHPNIEDQDTTEQVSWHNQPPMNAPMPEVSRQNSLHPEAFRQASLHPESAQNFEQRSFPPFPSQASLHPENASAAPVGQGYITPRTIAAPPQKRSRNIALILVVLVVLIAVAAAGYVGYTHLTPAAPTQGTITTTPLNNTIMYAGVAITVVRAQQTTRFLDDPNVKNTNPSAMIRLTMQAQNKTNAAANIEYNRIASLVTPDGKVITPTYVKAVPGVAQSATQMGTVDFIVPANTQLAQVNVRIGATNEAQMDVPLTAHADMSKYATKTMHVSGTAAYQGLNWSVVSAKTSFSNGNQQAGKGLYFMVLTLSVDNTLTQTAIPGSPFDFLRLKVGNTTAMPQDSTLPLSYAVGATGKTGTVMFQAPQNATQLTLVFLGVNGFNQQTLNFHL